MVKINKKILDFFSSLSDETRLRIVLSLTEGSARNSVPSKVGTDVPFLSGKNVGDIHKVFKGKITLPAVSHQLKLLENAGLIVYEKKGREKIFRLADGFCWCIVKDVFGHFGSGKKCKCKECCSIKSGGAPLGVPRGHGGAKNEESKVGR